MGILAQRLDFLQCRFNPQKFSYRAREENTSALRPYDLTLLERLDVTVWIYRAVERQPAAQILVLVHSH